MYIVNFLICSSKFQIKNSISFKFKIRFLKFYLYHFSFQMTLLDSECVQTGKVSTSQTSNSQNVRNYADTSGSSLHVADTQRDGNPNGSNYKSNNETQQPW